MRNYLALSYFIEVVTHLSFTEAAKKLHVSQPGLSQQIARLEKEIGHQLLERTTRTVRPTEAGQYLYDHLSHSFRNIDQVVATLRQSKGVPRAKLRIATVMSAASTVLPGVVKRLKADNPDLEFYIHETASARAGELVLSGEYDLGFVRTPLDSRILAPSRLKWFEFQKEPLQLAVSTDHWAAERDEIDLIELKEETFLHYDAQESPSLYHLVEQACLSAGFIPKTIGSGPEVLTRANLIRSGIGITLLPRDMIRLLEPYSIKGVSLRDLDLTSSLAVVWNELKETEIVLNALQILESFAGELPRMVNDIVPTGPAPD